MNVKISDEDKNKIISELSSHITNLRCPMCQGKNFVIADGYFNNMIQTNFSDGLVIGGPSIPTIGIVCTNCGFVSQHALGILKLMPKPKDDNNVDK